MADATDGLDDFEDVSDSVSDSEDDAGEETTEEGNDETQEGESSEDESSEDSEESEGSEEEETEDSEDSETEDEEDSESDEDVDEEDEEVDAKGPFDRPTIKDIKEKYPKFFKDFPELRHAFFREKEFSNLFPSVDEAKEAAYKANEFDALEGCITEGNLHPLFETLHKNDPATLRTFVTSFLPTLYEGSRELFAEVTDPILKNFINSVKREGIRIGGDKGKNMQIAARYFAHELTGQAEVADVDLARKGDSPEVTRLREQRSNEVKQRHQELLSDVRNETNVRLTKIIMKDLDPNKALPRFTREAIAKKIDEEIRAKLKQDPSYQSRMDLLWRRAQKSGFRSDAKPQLVSTFLGRARQLLVPIRQKARKDAQLDKGEKKPVKKVLRGGTSSGKTTSSKLDPKAYRGMSALDILNDKKPAVK